MKTNALKMLTPDHLDRRSQVERQIGAPGVEPYHGVVLCRCSGIVASRLVGPAQVVVERAQPTASARAGVFREIHGLAVPGHLERLTDQYSV